MCNRQMPPCPCQSTAHLGSTALVTTQQHPLACPAPQVAWAQLQVLTQLALLLQYLLWSQTLAHWSLLPEDSQQIESVLLPRTLNLLQAAAVAYWGAVTPVQDGSAAGAEGGAGALDPAQLVVALRIGEGPPGAGGDGAGAGAGVGACGWWVACWALHCQGIQ